MTIPAVQYPIEVSPLPVIWRGDPYGIDLTFTDVDLTLYGSSWSAQLRYSFTTDPAVSFTVDDSDAADGVLHLDLDGEQTAALDQGLYGFDVQATGGAVDPFTVFVCRRQRVDGEFTHA